jgi:hypothetical protein
LTQLCACEPNTPSFWRLPCDVQIAEPPPKPKPGRAAASRLASPRQTASAGPAAAGTTVAARPPLPSGQRRLDDLLRPKQPKRPRVEGDGGGEQAGPSGPQRGAEAGPSSSPPPASRERSRSGDGVELAGDVRGGPVRLGGEGGGRVGCPRRGGEGRAGGGAGPVPAQSHERHSGTSSQGAGADGLLDEGGGAALEDSQERRRRCAAAALARLRVPLGMADPLQGGPAFGGLSSQAGGGGRQEVPSAELLDDMRGQGTPQECIELLDSDDE